MAAHVSTRGSRGWKDFERQVAEVIGGRRFWANAGEALDCESDGVVAQAKLVRVCSLAELTRLAEQAERDGRVKQKIGVVVIKLRAGRGRPTPILFVQTLSMWVEQHGETRPLSDAESACGNPRTPTSR